MANCSSLGSRSRSRRLPSTWPSVDLDRARRGRRSCATIRPAGAMDFLVVPTINFRLLPVLVILRHERRRLISLNVIDHPTAEWIAQQITEAFPWDEAPTGLIRDRDARYGQAVRRRLSAMGIRDHPIAPRFTVAEWLCGEADWLDPSGMPGPRGDPGRRPFVSGPQSLCCLLQRVPNAPVPGQGRTVSSTGPTIWSACRKASPRWASSPVLPDLVLRRDSGSRVSPL